MKRLISLTSVLFLFVLMPTIQSCNSLKEFAMQDLELLSTSAYSELDQEEYIVIKDTNSLNVVYSKISTDLEVPVIDWAQHQVVLLAIGSRSTGGYSIAVDSVSKTKSELVVYYKTTSPKPGDRVTQAFTAAYALYKIANKQNLPILFKELD